MAKDNKFDLQPYLDKINEFDPNDIDWENMGSWPIAGKAVFCTIIALAILIGGYFMMLEPMQKKLSREIKQETQLKKDFENKAFQVANLEDYKAQMLEMEQSFESILKQLPRDTEVPGLIDDISLAALNNGLDLKVISPQKQVSTEFYNELPIEIEVEGDYHELGAYVSSVASLPRIVTLHDFSISKKGKDGDSLSLKILAKTYRYNEGD
jgi:type IV pilus assembly protein PilO